MSYSLMILSRVLTETLDNGNDLVSLMREAEGMFPAWAAMADFIGIAIVENGTGEVVHLVQ